MKPKSKKTLIILTGLAAAGAGVYFIFRKDQSRVGSFVRNVEQVIKGEEEYVEDVVVNAPVSTGGGAYSSEIFPLKRGMGGSNVRAMQTILNELYIDKIGAKISVDGKFGENTEKALVKAVGKKQLTKDEFLSLATAATAKSKIAGEGILDNFLASLFFE